MSGDSETNGKLGYSRVRFGQAFFVWLKISLLSFGGPAGQIAVMHRLLVEELKWISEKRFLHALNFCMLLPGPEAQQLTIYLGWLLHRVRGGVVAGVLFVLPGAVTVLFLSIIYVKYQQSMVVAAVFFGVKAAVLAIVMIALWRLAQKLIRKSFLMGIAVGSFIATFVFSISFPLVIVAAALVAFVANAKLSFDQKQYPEHKENSGEKGSDWEDNWRAIDRVVLTQPLALHRPLLLVVLACALLWLTPVAVLYGWFGTSYIYTQQAMFFSQVAVVTFGGAYAVLSYMAQQTVEQYGWLSAGEMLDGLGMAEATPGPLIMVTQFVGFIGAYRSPGMLDPMLAGCLGALVTTWVTFAPCFLWIFLGAPYIESLRGNRTLAVVFTGITAAVVGVVLNLAIWFGVRVLFSELVELPLMIGDITLALPSLASFNPFASAITAASLLAIAKFRVGMITALAASSAAGLALWSAGLV